MYSNTGAFKNKPTAAGPPAAQPLIDTVGVDAIAALGFKKLRSAYTGDCIQLRNATSGFVTDIGFDANGDLDTAAIASFCGTDNGTISIWYDQSGNGFNFSTAQTPNAGNTSQEPYIYFNQAITTDVQGNIAAFSVAPTSNSHLGERFMNSPTMTARNKPNITIFAQVNTYNGNGIMQTEQENGFNIGTYGGGGNVISVIKSNGAVIKTKAVGTARNDSFASTIFYNDEGGVGNSKWWITSYLDNATFEDSMDVNGQNAPTFNNVSIFRYNLVSSLYQNCAFSGWIYWDITDGNTFNSAQIYDLYDWVETNLGYTNNAP